MEAEKKKEELRRRQREEANRRRLAKEKVACLQLVRQVLPLSLNRAFEQLSAKSWETQSVQQVGDEPVETRHVYSFFPTTKPSPPLVVFWSRLFV